MTTPHRVAVLAFDGISPFHLSAPSVVLGGVVPGGAGLGYDVVVCAEQPGVLATGGGYAIVVTHGLEALDGAATVVVPSWDLGRDPSPVLLDAVRAAHARGARVVGLCLGAFVVAASGIVDGREVATHWAHEDDLVAGHPRVAVRRDVLWCDLGDVVTSAGTASALDCCLHLVRRDHGASVAARVARRLVLAPHREGTQAQFAPTPNPRVGPDDAVGRAMAWATDRLGDALTLDDLAAAAHLSRRHFSRRFRERTGSAVGDWLVAQRVDRARALLEEGDDPVEAVAAASGLGSAASLRVHFARTLGTTPSAYRRAFRGTPTAGP
ncbi:GlxA family transcriptional regulator [Luteimicrobium subarcticum]|uniref:Transcriptional regulator GlxA family with amidase domain n=1 Tax=Luteimicrobium subarcticum TaxID=620910 RepID=A0A2M8WJ99_9MICO|nr:helix-turn-helix domain-containing protein [Luteimicrobium subarcticum]PJI91004.1 transcriptional regulator GlxA family with amidase domain [Luteimicrobium subarcticum]